MSTPPSSQDMAGDQVGLAHDRDFTRKQATTALSGPILADGEVSDANNPPATSNSSKEKKPSYTNMPPEILEKIFSHLGTSDLKTVRQVNKLSADPASKWLYREVFFILLPESIAKLKGIATHPKINKHVHWLIYIGDALFDEHRNLAVWILSALEGAAPSAYDLVKQHSLAQYIKDQEILISQDELTTCLELALRNFEALEAVSIMSAPELEEISRDRFRRYSCVPILDKLTRASGLSIEKMFTNRNNENDLSFPGFSFLKALARTRVSLKRGRFVFVPEQFWESSPSRPTLYRDLRPGLATVLSGITEMTYKFEPRVEEDGISDFRLASITALSEVLRLTTSVKTLSLTSETRFLPPTNRGVFGHLPFQLNVSKLFSTALVPKLVVLHIEHLSATVKDFLKFMETHASTLRRINFKNLRLAYNDPHSETLELDEEIGAWEHAFNEMAGTMKIAQASCDSLSDDWMAARILESERAGFPVRMQCYIEAWFNDQLFRLCLGRVEGWESFQVQFLHPNMWQLTKMGANCGVAYKGMLHDFLMQPDLNFDDVSTMSDEDDCEAFFKIDLITAANATGELDAEKAFFR